MMETGTVIVVGLMRHGARMASRGVDKVERHGDDQEDDEK